jgi:hypothetical protein
MNKARLRAGVQLAERRNDDQAIHVRTDIVPFRLPQFLVVGGHKRNQQSSSNLENYGLSLFNEP